MLAQSINVVWEKRCSTPFEIFHGQFYDGALARCLRAGIRATFHSEANLCERSLNPQEEQNKEVRGCLHTHADQSLKGDGDQCSLPTFLPLKSK